MNHQKTIDVSDWKDAATELVQFLSEICAPPSSAPAWQWCELHIIVREGPFKGRWKAQLTPMARWVLEACQNPRVRRVTLMVSAQSAKTLLMLIFFNWCVKEDPADTMWVMADADHMGEFVEKRLLPSIQGCDAVAPLFVDAKKGLIKFDTMNLMLRGSNSRAKLQSDPVRRLFCDERREWKPGSIDLVRKRTRTFHNFMELSAGTAGKKDDELHADYKEGSQTVPHFNCLKCNHSQPFRFGRENNCFWAVARTKGGLVWDVNEVTKPNGIWDYEEVKKTVAFECENCGHRYKNTEKYDLIRTMHPHDYNPKQVQEFVSFHWGALEMIWETCNWENIVIEFLKAVELARIGNIEPLKAFITETLGEPWEDRLGIIEDFGFLEARKEKYDYGEVWAEEDARFMAADKQEKGGEHYRYVIRSFGKIPGSTRLVVNGRCNTKSELEQIRKNYNVPAVNSMIDSGYMAQDVYRFCMATGWKAFKGDHAEFYTKSKRMKNGQTKTFRSIWRVTKAAVYNRSTRARVGILNLFMFCNDPAKDLLAEYMTGLIGNWTIPEQVEREYLKQMTAERREEKTDPKGRITYFWNRIDPDNHYFDCELMILIAAIITKRVAGRMMEKTPQDKPKDIKAA